MNKKITINDFTDICRLCLKYSSSLQPLFPIFLHGQYGRYSKDTNQSIPDIIFQLTGLKINPEDGLPLNICAICEDALNTSNTFKTHCLASNAYLLELKKQSIKTADDVGPEFDCDDNATNHNLKSTELVLVDCIIKEEDVKPPKLMNLRENNAISNNYQTSYMDYEQNNYDNIDDNQKNDDNSDDGGDANYECNNSDDEDTEDDDDMSYREYEELLDEDDDETVEPNDTKKSKAKSKTKNTTPSKSTITATITKPSATNSNALNETINKTTGSRSTPLLSLKKQLNDTSLPGPSIQSINIEPVIEMLAQSTAQTGKRKRNKCQQVPKQCNVCGLIVPRLRDHMKTHPDQLLFKCTQCPRTYLTKNGLDRHIDIQHADERCGTTNYLNQMSNLNATIATVTSSSFTTNGTKVLISRANPYLWQCNIAKRSRELGQSYVNSKGKICAGRSLKQPCPTTCKYDCQFNILETERNRIHSLFWSLNQHDKLIFLSKFIEKLLPKKRKMAENLSRRQFTYKYYFNNKNNTIFDSDSRFNDDDDDDYDDNKRIQVCKLFFIRTLDITEKKIYWYFNHTHNMETGEPNPQKKKKRKKIK